MVVMHYGVIVFLLSDISIIYSRRRILLWPSECVVVVERYLFVVEYLSLKLDRKCSLPENRDAEYL